MGSSTKRKAVSAGVAVFAGLAFWFIAWPTFEPYVMDYMPVAGKNEITGMQVERKPDGQWLATISYFYTGWPTKGTLRVKALGDGEPDQPAPAGRVAVKGAHTVTIEVPRPQGKGPVARKQLLAELYEYPTGNVIAVRSLKREVQWPDYETWVTDGEISRSSAQAVLAKAAKLTDAGDIQSLFQARSLVRRLIARHPAFQPAIDEMVRITARAPWEKQNVAMIDSRETMAKVVRQLRNADAFQELDDLAANLLETRAVSSSGYSLIYFFHDAFNEGMDDPRLTPEMLNSGEKYAEDWIKRRPDSITAQMNLAGLLFEHAWRIRGGGVAANVTPAQWTGFRAYLQRAKAQLAQCYALCSKDPEWYVKMLAVMRGLSDPREEYFSTFVEGFTRFPDYPGIYEQVALSYTPQWGGSPQLFERFVRELTSKLPPAERDFAYARIYTDLVSFGPGFSGPDAAAWGVDCRRLMRGHDDIVSKFPTTYNVNSAAVAATQCKDKPAAARWLARLGNDRYLPSWGSDAERGAAEFSRAVAWAKS
jgi:hypothetical protein